MTLIIFCFICHKFSHFVIFTFGTDYQASFTQFAVSASLTQCLQVHAASVSELDHQ